MADNEITLSLEGLSELYATFNELIKSMDDDVVEPILMTGAKTFQQAAKSNAPVGPTGNLKKGIKTSFLPSLWGNPRSAMCKSSAPHDHLLEYGHINWRGGIRKDGQGHQIGGNGTMTFTPAHPWFRPAVDSKKPEVYSQVIADLGKNIDNAIK